MKVEVNTESKNVLYLQGEYPIGHITRVMDYYVRQSETFDKLFENMKARIKELEDKQNELDQSSEEWLLANMMSCELKAQLLDVNCWWEPSMEDTSRLHSPETCFHLRQSGGGKLGR